MVEFYYVFRSDSTQNYHDIRMFQAFISTDSSPDESRL